MDALVANFQAISGKPSRTRAAFYPAIHFLVFFFWGGGSHAVDADILVPVSNAVHDHGIVGLVIDFPLVHGFYI